MILGWIVSMSALAVLGLGLLYRGIRGRRVDDHPLCRGCGYDLVGHGEGVVRCPECGVDPGKKKRKWGGGILGNRNPGVVIGHRKRRRVSIGVGVLLLMLAGSGGGVMVWQQQSGFNWNTIKPVWWLRLEGRSGSTTRVDGVREELLSRMMEDKLEKSEVVLIAEDFLAVHADPEGYWTEDLSAFIERGWVFEEVPDEQFKEYLRNAVNPAMSVEVRPKVREGMRIPFRYVMGAARVSSDLGSYSRTVPVGLQYSFWRTEIDGELMTQYRGGVGGFGKISSTGRSSIGSSAKAELKPGPHEFVLTERFRVFVGDAAAKGTPHHDEVPFVEWTHTAKASFEVVPGDAETVRLNTDSKLDKTIREMIKIRMGNQEIPEATSTMPHRIFYNSNFSINGYLPVDLVFDLYGRKGETEKLIGSWSLQESGTFLGLPNQTPFDLFPEANAIDIILRANPRLAEKTVDITEIWGGEIVFEDVVLREAEEEDSDTPAD